MGGGGRRMFTVEDATTRRPNDSATEELSVHSHYTPYEGTNLANHISRMLGVFDRKLEGNHYYIPLLF